MNNIYGNNGDFINSSKKKPVIGIIGGAGPDATIDLQIKLSKTMKERLHIMSDQDHYRVIIDNNSQLADRNNALLYGANSPVRSYINSAQTLESIGADILIIPCNTAHAYFKDIQRSISIKMVNMVEETCNFLGTILAHEEKVGLLSTSATIKTGLYHNALEKYGIEVISPNVYHQEKVTQAIYGIKAGFNSHNKILNDLEKTKLFNVYKDHSYLKNKKLDTKNIKTPAQLLIQSINYLVNKGIKHVILGCTEIPIVINEYYRQESCVLIDPTLILAQQTVEQAMLIEKKKLSA